MVVVLGVLLILTLIVAGIAGQIRSQLRVTRVDENVASVHSIITSAVQAEATKLQNDLDAVWGANNSRQELEDYLRNLAPAACSVSDGGLLQEGEFCTRRHAGLQGTPEGQDLVIGSAYSYPLWQVPVEVRWSAHGGAEKSVYAWMLVDVGPHPDPPTDPPPAQPPKVVMIIQDRELCAANPDWVYNRSGELVCEVGG